MRLKLRLSIVLAVVVGLLIPAAVGSLLTLRHQERTLAARLSADHARLTEVLALGVESPMWNVSPDSARPLVESLLGDERVVQLVARDERSGTFLAAERPERRKGRQFILRRNVSHQGVVIGDVMVEIDTGPFESELANARTSLILTIVGQLLLSLLLIVGILNARLVAPIRRLMTESDQLARRELDAPFLWRRDDELGSLGAALERTRQSLAELFGELEAKNRELRVDIERRIEIEAELKRHREHLEEMIAGRTAELAQTIAHLEEVFADAERAKDAAVVANRAKSNFLATMSHELRTPLNGILGFAQILRRDKPLSERQARGLKIIDESGHHLLTLINDILDLARIDAAKLDLFPTEINLLAFLQVVSDMVRVKAEERSLLFIYQPAPGLPAAVRVDEKRLRQVLLNLLSNAVKFTDSGQVSLGVQVLPIDRQRERSGIDPDSMSRLRFEVRDSGIGMNEVQLARLFQPFEQVADVNRREGGTGLGLAISRQLIRLMGGDIQVQSQPGQGSVFSFELDLPAVRTQIAALPVYGSPVGYAGIRKKVLVVDDVAQNRAMLLDALAVLGFDVTDACNGAECLDAAGKARPDLIVMDVMMPVMDGYEATRRIRLMPQLAEVPILATSASATQEVEARCRAAGASAFISKPIDHELLLLTIGRLMGIRWVYPQSDMQPSELLDAAPGVEHIGPPSQDLFELRQLARTGNMRAIREWADRLKGRDAKYAPFATRLAYLADACQSKAIATLVERCSAPQEQG